MSSQGDFGWSAAGLRIVGSTAFVVTTIPFGPMPTPQGLHGIPLPLAIIGAILVLSAHSYLAVRAYYALHRRGLALAAIVTICASIFILTNISSQLSFLEILYVTLAGYLSLVYSFGLIYNHIDGKLSGLVHAKDVY